MAPPDEPTPAAPIPTSSAPTPTPVTPTPADPVRAGQAPWHPLPGEPLTPGPSAPYGATSSFSAPAYGTPVAPVPVQPAFTYAGSGYAGAGSTPTRSGPGATSVVAIVLAALALVIGVIALIVGVMSLATSAVGALADPYGTGGGFVGYGDAAEYGEYVGTSEFAGLRSIDDLHEGLCFDAVELDADFTGTVAPLTCDQPHDYEVYSVSRLADGEFPGDDAVYEQTYPGCEEEFGDFVGIGYYDSVAEYGILAPTERSWDEGERDVLCFAFEYSLTRPGTLRDTEE